MMGDSVLLESCTARGGNALLQEIKIEEDKISNRPDLHDLPGIGEKLALLLEEVFVLIKEITHKRPDKFYTIKDLFEELPTRILQLLNNLSLEVESPKSSHSLNEYFLVCTLSLRLLKVVHRSFVFLKDLFQNVCQIQFFEDIKQAMYSASNKVLVLMNTTLTMMKGWISLRAQNTNYEDEHLLFSEIFNIIKLSSERNELHVLSTAWKRLSELNMQTNIPELPERASEVLLECILLHLNHPDIGFSAKKINLKMAGPLMRFYLSQINIYLKSCKKNSNYIVFKCFREMLLVMIQVLIVPKREENTGEEQKTMKAICTLVEKFCDVCKDNRSNFINALFLMGTIDNMSILPSKCYSTYSDYKETRDFSESLLKSIIIRYLIVLAKEDQCKLVQSHIQDWQELPKGLFFKCTNIQIIKDLITSISRINPLTVHSSEYIRGMSLYRHSFVSVVSFITEMCSEAWSPLEKQLFFSIIKPSSITEYIFAIDLIKYFQKQKLIDFTDHWLNSLIPGVLSNIPNESLLGLYIGTSMEILDYTSVKSDFPQLADHIRSKENYDLRDLRFLSNILPPYNSINSQIQYCLEIWRDLWIAIQNEKDIFNLSIYYASLETPARFAMNIIKRVTKSDSNVPSSLLPLINEISESISVLILSSQVLAKSLRESNESLILLSQSLSCCATLAELALEIKKVVKNFNHKFSASALLKFTCEDDTFPRSAMANICLLWNNTNDASEASAQNKIINWMVNVENWAEKHLMECAIKEAFRLGKVNRESLDSSVVENLKNLIKREIYPASDPKNEERIRRFISDRFMCKHSDVDCLLKHPYIGCEANIYSSITLITRSIKNKHKLSKIHVSRLRKLMDSLEELLS